MGSCPIRAADACPMQASALRMCSMWMGDQQRWVLCSQSCPSILSSYKLYSIYILYSKFTAQMAGELSIRATSMSSTRTAMATPCGWPHVIPIRCHGAKMLMGIIRDVCELHIRRIWNPFRILVFNLAILWTNDATFLHLTHRIGVYSQKTYFVYLYISKYVGMFIFVCMYECILKGHGWSLVIYTTNIMLS